MAKLSVTGNWKDKRSVRFITTRHTLKMMDTNKNNRKGESIYKPEAITHKVAFEYLFGTSVINALILYQLSNKKKIQIADFREALVTGLGQTDQNK